MKYLKITLIIIFTFITTNVFCQNYQNQIYMLKDSSLIYGKFLNYDEYNIMLLVNNEVARIKKGDILKIYKAKSEQSKLINNTPSYFSITDIGMLAGERNDIKKYSLSIHMINGIQLNEKFSTGLGFGVEFMDFNLIPIFADLRWNLNKNKTQIFVGMQGGFVFPLEENRINASWDSYNYKMGYFYNPLIGIKANFKSSRNAFVISLGFRHMTIMGEREDDWRESVYERSFIYDRFSLRVGYYFN